MLDRPRNPGKRPDLPPSNTTKPIDSPSGPIGPDPGVQPGTGNKTPPANSGDAPIDAPPGHSDSPPDVTQFPEEGGQPVGQSDMPDSAPGTNEQDQVRPQESGGASPEQSPESGGGGGSGESSQGDSGSSDSSSRSSDDKKKDEKEDKKGSSGIAFLGSFEVACIGVPTAHGFPLGGPAAGTKRTFVNGRPVFRCGIDVHVDSDGSGVVPMSISAQPTVLWEGFPAAVKGDIIAEASVAGPNLIIPGAINKGGTGQGEGGIGDAVSDFFHALARGDLDAIQDTLSIIGIADPTFVADLINALISFGRGNVVDGLINSIAMVPYIGDVAKGIKAEARIAEHAAEAAARKAEKEAAEAAIKAEKEAAQGAEKQAVHGAEGKPEGSGGQPHEGSAKTGHGGKAFEDNGGIEAFEGPPHNGHTMERHVGKTDDQLAQRANNPKFTGDSASTYPDVNTANRAISDVLDQKSAEIDKWLNGPNQGRLTVQADNLGYGTGRSVPKGGNVANETTGAKVVLQKDATSPTGYKVVTSFPR